MYKQISLDWRLKLPYMSNVDACNMIFSTWTSGSMKNIYIIYSSSEFGVSQSIVNCVSNDCLKYFFLLLRKFYPDSTVSMSKPITFNKFVHFKSMTYSKNDNSHEYWCNSYLFFWTDNQLYQMNGVSFFFSFYRIDFLVSVSIILFLNPVLLLSVGIFLLLK